MDIIQAIILGLVQGATEWLPVSSLAHFEIFNRMVQAEQTLSFYYLLHIGSLLSILIYYRTRIIRYFMDHDPEAMFSGNALFVLISSIPFLLTGYFIYDLIDAIFDNMFYPAIGLIITSAVLLSTKFFNSDGKPSLLKSIMIGMLQTASLFPGISRTGINISSAIWLKISKEDAFDLGIMMAVPVLLGMTIHSIILSGIPFELSTLIGILSSALAGVVALIMLKGTMLHEKISKYWMYCLIVGIILLFN